jgi:hypothetical protein
MTIPVHFAHRNRPTGSVKPAQLALALIVGVLVAGCRQPSNSPTAYGDVAQANFVHGCTQAGRGVKSCSCAYGVLSGPSGVPFDEFKKIDQNLATNPAALPDSVKAKLSVCPTTTTGGPATSGPPPTPDPADGTTG